ncbi:MAG: HD-GYP domain-containing protein [Sporomusaceae bacterium]|nr:HD-GYP domain-containing protein [Sporomusaceae bacterium]
MSNRITLDDLHDMVDALSRALEAKNAHMCGHSERVAELSLLISQQIELSKKEQQIVHIGAHLHDIGKIGIPDSILNKPGKLTEGEFAIIRQHPEIGGDIVSKVKVFHSVVDIVRHHHERFDGKGYPDKLCGAEISIGARIVSVADAFDAMISMRSYRPPLNVSEAIGELERCQGSQFDPDIVDVLKGLINNNELQCINTESIYRSKNGCC